MDKKLIIIPTYNEIENAEKIIRTVLALPEQYDILIIDDGSPDGTAGIVKNLQHEVNAEHGGSEADAAERDTGEAKNGMDTAEHGAGEARNSGDASKGSAAVSHRLNLIERKSKMGLGTAYITGFKWALERGYEYIFEMDADFSHDPADLARLYKECAEEGADVAIGSRYCKGVNVVNWPMKRVLMSWSASKYVRFILHIPVNDCTAGFVCYRAEVLRAIDLDAVQMKGYGFQIEMKYTAYRLGYRIGEVSVIFRDRTEGKSKMSSTIFGEAFWGVIRLRFRKIRRIAS